MSDMTPYSIGTGLSDKRFKLLVLGLLTLLVVILIAISGMAVYSARQFHLIGTDPPLNQFPASAPQVTLNYSKPLATGNIAAYLTPNVPTTLTVSGKQLIVRFQTTLEEGKSYSLALQNIASTTGDRLPDTTLTFTPQNIPFQQLSPTTQQAITKNQDQAPPSRNTIAFAGTDALLNQGVSIQQVDAMKQAVFLFGQSQKKTFVEAIIDPSSVKAVPRDPSSASPYFSVTFNITLDNTQYNATLSYANITVARLVLASGHTQVYDSGDIDDSAVTD